MYSKLPVTVEVFRALRKQYGDIWKVFSSYSAPDGDYHGNPNEGVMMTEFGLDQFEHPIVGAETKWDIDREHPHERKNLRERFWLCIPNGEEE